jgi:putative hemolysin
VQEALDRALASGRSRFPVGDGSVDRVIGIAHVRDVALAVRRGAPAAVGDLTRPVLIVPETKDVGALLRELREGRQTLAVVADEYGGTAGIVTVEDIVEELVGEIEDEFELPDATVTRLDELTVEVAGSMSVDDVNEDVGTRLPQDGPRTVAGLVFDRLGRRPAPDDEVDVDGTQLRVAEVDGVRITRVVIRLPVTPGEEEIHDDGP